VNLYDSYGDTALIGASRNGHTDMACHVAERRRHGCEY
jgi:ankyrin repeat protein